MSERLIDVSNPHLLTLLEDLPLKPRTKTFLRSSSYRVDFAVDLARLYQADLFRIKGFGHKSVRDVEDVLRDIGLGTGMVAPL